jgi:hypothetical protein
MRVSVQGGSGCGERVTRLYDAGLSFIGANPGRGDLEMVEI